MDKKNTSAIIKEKVEQIQMEYKDAFNILDAYDHQMLTIPEGTYYDGNESVEEAAVDVLYSMIKDPIWCECNKQVATMKFLQILEWNNALYDDNGKKKISDKALAAMVIMIDKSREEEKEMIKKVVLNCL